MKLGRAIWLVLILGASLGSASAQDLPAIKVSPLFQVEGKFSADDPIDYLNHLSIKHDIYMAEIDLSGRS